MNVNWITNGSVLQLPTIHSRDYCTTRDSIYDIKVASFGIAAQIRVYKQIITIFNVWTYRVST